MILGLTGQSGAGKGTVAALMSANGFVHIDGDILARKVTEKGTACLDELAAVFGGDILAADGSLDRKRLAAVAFSDRNKLRKLNSIIHKYIAAETEIMIEESRRRGDRGVIIDGAALYESGLHKLCGKIICVTAPFELRLRRIMSRDGISREAALARMNAQPGEEDYTALADYIIVNNGTCEHVKKTTEDIVNRLSKEYNNV